MYGLWGVLVDQWIQWIAYTHYVHVHAYVFSDMLMQVV